MGKFIDTSKVLLGSALIAFAGAPWAGKHVASLARIDGTVLVNQGEQYANAREGMGLNLGDRLMVLKGGKATIQFSDGCRYTQRDTEVLTIAEVSSCKSKPSAGRQVAPYFATAIDPLAKDGVSTDETSSGETAGNGGSNVTGIGLNSTTAFVGLGGIGVLGGLAAGLGFLDDDDPTNGPPISP